MVGFIAVSAVLLWCGSPRMSRRQGWISPTCSARAGGLHAVGHAELAQDVCDVNARWILRALTVELSILRIA